MRFNFFLRRTSTRERLGRALGPFVEGIKGTDYSCSICSIKRNTKSFETTVQCSICVKFLTIETVRRCCARTGFTQATMFCSVSLHGSASSLLIAQFRPSTLRLNAQSCTKIFSSHLPQHGRSPHPRCPHHATLSHLRGARAPAQGTLHRCASPTPPANTVNTLH